MTCPNIKVENMLLKKQTKQALEQQGKEDLIKHIAKLKTNMKTAQESYEMEISKLKKEKEELKLSRDGWKHGKETMNSMYDTLKKETIILKDRNRELKKGLSKYPAYSEAIRENMKLNKEIEKLNILKQGWKERSELLDKENKDLVWNKEEIKKVTREVNLDEQILSLKEEIKRLRK